MDEDTKREPGTFAKEQRGLYHEERIDGPSCFLDIKFGKSTTQGFGGLCLKKGLDKAFEREVCDVFGVNTLKQLGGRKVIALRNFGHFNETIEGLENPDNGRRFTITGFRRRHGGMKGTRLQELQGHAENEVKWAQERLARAQKELREMRLNYTDWGD